MLVVFGFLHQAMYRNSGLHPSVYPFAQFQKELKEEAQTHYQELWELEWQSMRCTDVSGC
jgi:hypothetical protein